MTAQVFRYSAIVIAIALALSSSIGAQSGHELFQQALSKERAEGKLQEAIALYQRVVEVASADHALAARALLQLGRCYEQLGNAEARSAYERLIARYPDQADMVAQARTRLAVLVRAQQSLAPAVMTVQPLADVNKVEVQAVSPDGTKAIVMDYSKGQNIALYDFATKQMRLLTDLDWSMGWTYWAVWSPDGRRVAYVHGDLREIDGKKVPAIELRVTTLDGRSSAVYRADAGGPLLAVQPLGWTPDGTTLVVVGARLDKTAAIGTLPANGGAFTPLKSLGWSYDYYEPLPRVSPDGRFIAYLEGETGLRDVHVVSLDGRESSRITDHPGDDFAPIWSPDGRHLAFTSNRLGSVALWTVEVKDGKPVGQPVKLKDDMQTARPIDWIDRGILYQRTGVARDLYTVPMDPIEQRPTGPPRLVPYSRTGLNYRPAWSPDGKSLAFVSRTVTEPNRRSIVVMSPDGGQIREFVIPTSFQVPLSPFSLRWFGNGRGLGFLATNSRGAPGPAVFRLLLETGQWDTIPLTSTLEGERTRSEWNRDGSAFYFERRFLEPGIFERAVNGDAERPIYRFSPSVTIIEPLELSPDRKWLAFQQVTPPDAKTGTSLTAPILVVDVATGETRTVLEGVIKVGSSYPTLMGWTPSGDLLVRQPGTGSTAPQFQLVPMNGGTPRSIAIPTFASSGPGDSQANLVARWSPDGRTMVLVRESRVNETFIIENPLAGVRAATVSR